MGQPPQPKDPLEHIWPGRVVVLVTGLMGLLVLAASATRDAPSDLPGIALGAPALLHLERALVVSAVVAGSFIFLVRGWAGYFPSKLSTTGAEYSMRPSAQGTAATDDSAIDALAEIRTERVAMVRSMRADLRALELKLEAKVARGQSDRHRDDML